MSQINFSNFLVEAAASAGVATGWPAGLLPAACSLPATFVFLQSPRPPSPPPVRVRYISSLKICAFNDKVCKRVKNVCCFVLKGILT